jgi:integral membrane protein
MLHWFRKIAIAEGISFLVLLLIAMPLKYLAGWQMAVKIVGWAHGVLFVAFLVMAFEVKLMLGKNFVWFMKAFLASIIPFGTFVLDKELKKEERIFIKGNEG